MNNNPLPPLPHFFEGKSNLTGHTLLSNTLHPTLHPTYHPIIPTQRLVSVLIGIQPQMIVASLGFECMVFHQPDDEVNT